MATVEDALGGGARCARLDQARVVGATVRLIGWGLYRVRA